MVTGELSGRQMRWVVKPTGGASRRLAQNCKPQGNEAGNLCHCPASSSTPIVLALWEGSPEILTMPDKTLRQVTAAFHAAKVVHLIVKLVEAGFRLLAGVRETGSPLATFGLSDIHIISWVKLLCLGALVYFEVIKIEAFSTLHPGIVSQQRHRTVVTMGVNGPVREDYVRMFCLQKFSKVVIAGPA